MTDTLPILDELTPLTDVQEALRHMVRDFAAKEIAPRVARANQEEQFPGDLLAKMAEVLPDESRDAAALLRETNVAGHRMARSSVYLGLLLVAIGVPMGLVWAQRLTGSYSLGDPKVLVTVVILVVYLAYLRLSRIAQWRGSRAALLCALNFMIVLFSYTFVNFYLTRFHRFF